MTTTPTVDVANYTALQQEAATARAAEAAALAAIPTALPPNGAAGGALTGTYPNPTLAVAPVPLTQKAAANGVATLDAGSKVPLTQMPDLSGTYAAVSSMAETITYNGDGTVNTVTETGSGAVTTYTYNSDGTPATESRLLGGVTTTRTFTYSGGLLVGVA